LVPKLAADLGGGGRSAFALPPLDEHQSARFGSLFCFESGHGTECEWPDSADSGRIWGSFGPTSETLLIFRPDPFLPSQQQS
jgi:hypothetical protein